MSEIIITANNISKRYDSKFILKEVNMTIEKGQSIALMGHNGSGKSTFLKLVSGLVSLDYGSFSYDHKLKFNYIPEHFPKSLLTPKKYINLAGQLEGLTSHDIKERSEALFHDFFMDNMTETPMKHLSKGSLQKVGVIQALLTSPDVLLLDEPLSGQDMDSQAVFIAKIKALLKQKVTVIMSCHEPFLVESISDTIYRIKDCRLHPVELNEIRQRRPDRLVFTARYNKKLSDEILSMTIRTSSEDDSLIIDVDKEKSNELIVKMIDAGYTLRRMNHD